MMFGTSPPPDPAELQMMNRNEGGGYDMAAYEQPMPRATAYGGIGFGLNGVGPMGPTAGMSMMGTPMGGGLGGMGMRGVGGMGGMGGIAGMGGMGGMGMPGMGAMGHPGMAGLAAMRPMGGMPGMGFVLVWLSSSFSSLVSLRSARTLSFAFSHNAC